MENLVIEATECTPSIRLNGTQHTLKIEGYSYPENASLFFAPVFRWLKEYFSVQPPGELEVKIEIVYFNSSSSKALLDFFDLLSEEAIVKNVLITVNWIYEERDEDMREFGEEFQQDFRSLTFNFIKK